jgi:hypothetical protein
LYVGCNYLSSADKGPPKFFCEPCEKGFQTQSDYDTHVKKHANCEEPGCKFRGSQAALQVHHLRVHNERIRDLLQNINTPEGLAKYREERRKNYPTKENVAKKVIYLSTLLIYVRKRNYEKRENEAN